MGGSNRANSIGELGVDGMAWEDGFVSRLRPSDVSLRGNTGLEIMEGHR